MFERFGDFEGLVTTIQSNNLSFGNLLKTFLVIPKEGLETLECLKCSKFLRLPSNYLRLDKMSKMHFDMTK